jgi:hypothetical protein
MITYSKVLWGLHLIPRVYGSALPRALPFSVLSAGLTALIFHWKEPLFADIRTTQPYAFQVFVYVAAFAIIFRTNFGYNRYMPVDYATASFSGHSSVALHRHPCVLARAIAEEDGPVLIRVSQVLGGPNADPDHDITMVRCRCACMHPLPLGPTCSSFASGEGMKCQVQPCLAHRVQALLHGKVLSHMRCRPTAVWDGT